MICQTCDQTMQRETVVRVMRIGLFRRTRSVVQPGWHCWSCRTSPARMAGAPDPRAAQSDFAAACHAGSVAGRPRQVLALCGAAG